MEDKIKPLKGSVRELWKKDIKECPFYDLLTRIALDAKYIVSCSKPGSKKLDIFNFDGIQEMSIDVKPISKIAVTSDCSRILIHTISTGKDIVAYNLEGQIELEVKSTQVVNSLRSSLDGRLFAVNDNQNIKVWDWNGNVINQVYTPSLRSTFDKFEVAPDGSYIVYTEEGSMGRSDRGGLGIERTPDIDEMLKYSDLMERFKAWSKEALMGADWYKWTNSKVDASNKRLVLIKGSRIGVIDIEEDKLDKIHSIDIVSKTERLEWVKMTSDGRYLYYARRHGKVTSLEIFDLESRVPMKELFTFPDQISVSFCASHDGSKILAFIRKSKGWFSSETTVSMISVE